MILNNILTLFISCSIVIILYIVFNHCRSKYRWRKLKRHVTEAIETLGLWDKVNAIHIKSNEFLSIIRFMDDHKYKHSFYERGGAFLLYYVLGEIRNEHEQEGK